MPNITRIIVITGSEPPGTPAAPMPPSTHISTTSSCCTKLSSMPKNWARNSTVTPSNSAVPFMLAVAPSVQTKRPTRRGVPRFSSATRSVVGRVAPEELVENAVRMAGWAWRKKNSGDIPPAKRTSSGNTTKKCTAMAPAATSTNSASCLSAPKPTLAVMLNSSANTA